MTAGKSKPQELVAAAVARNSSPRPPPPSAPVVPAGPAQARPRRHHPHQLQKFPDMHALGQYIHSKGLKFGIYSSPGPTTCGGYAASWQHEEQDAKTWASWGVDYIKYDWCSYSNVVAKAPAGSVPRENSGFDMATLKRPYQDIRKALDGVDRDMVMSLCQYGWGNVWEWGAEPGINGNVWRATGDIHDNWRSMSNIGFAQNGHETFSGPGHWNDTDMLVVGKVGWGPMLHDSKLTQNEQLTHISLWSILAAPMLLGCDLTQLDPFTRALMTNDEVLAVNQDPLGKMGHRIAQIGNTQVWARPLWDGTTAVGLFNLDNAPAPVSISLADLKLTAPQEVRDIWQLKNLSRTPPTPLTCPSPPPRRRPRKNRHGPPPRLTPSPLQLSASSTDRLYPECRHAGFGGNRGSEDRSSLGVIVA